MSLRIVPTLHHPSSTSTSYTGAPSAPGIHDTLRANLSLQQPAPTATSTPSAPLVLQSSHPLESRLTQWRATQDALKMSMLSRQFGIAEPVRRGMEMQIVQGGAWRPSLLGGSLRGGGVHGDILSGRDCEVGWEDVFVGNEFREIPDFHTEMEGRMRMNW